MARWVFVDEIGKTAYKMVLCGCINAINYLWSIFFSW